MPTERRREPSPAIPMRSKPARIYLAEITDHDGRPIPQDQHHLLARLLKLVPYPSGASTLQQGPRFRVYRVLGTNPDQINRQSQTFVALAVEPEVQPGHPVPSVPIPPGLRDVLAVRTAPTPLDPGIVGDAIPDIISFTASPEGIQPGQRMDISWQVADELNRPLHVVIYYVENANPPGFFQYDNLPLVGTFSTYPAHTRNYTLDVRNATGKTLAQKQIGATVIHLPPVTPPGPTPTPTPTPTPPPPPPPPPPPTCTWFYFRMDAEDPAAVNLCFTTAICSSDEPTAQATAVQKNLGYTATPIDWQSYNDGCPA